MIERFRVVGEKMPIETVRKVNAYLADHNGEDFEVVIRRAPAVYRPVHCAKGCGRVAEMVPHGVSECRVVCKGCRND